MITVHVIFHKDGDKLAIVKVPWWTNVYEKIISKFCACCSWRGWLWNKVTNFERYDVDEKYKFKEWLYVQYFDKFGKVLFWPAKFERVLYEATIDDACQASLKIFKNKHSCFRDDCESCWELREDAYHGTNSGYKN
jgi:hypothetical protein